MKNIFPKLVKSLVATNILIVICYLALLLMGKLSATTMKLIASLSAMYGFPIILGNMLLLNIEGAAAGKGSGLFKKIIQSVGLSMGVLFVTNFILWVVIWGAPIGDLFTERNTVFYLIGFCILIVVSTLFHSISSRIYSKKAGL